MLDKKNQLVIFNMHAQVYVFNIAVGCYGHQS